MSAPIDIEVPVGPADEVRRVRITSPDRVYFPDARITKLDLVTYYLLVGEGALRGVKDRPTVLKRYPEGITGEVFFQKRLPPKRPDWLRSITVTFPSGRTAEELCPADLAHVIWAANIGCLDLNPWPVRRWEPEQPDELRIDLDPQPGVPFAAVRTVALAVGELLGEMDLVGWPKTSGSRGIHILVRIVPRWGFVDVRRAAVALARELERRLPDLVTTAWWKEQRGEKVFVDYNQNARDRTVASAYSVRALPDARVSTPLSWEEVADVDPAAFTLRTVPARFAELGDLHAGIDDEATTGRIDALLEMAERDEQAGLGDLHAPTGFPSRGRAKR